MTEPNPALLPPDLALHDDDVVEAVEVVGSDLVVSLNGDGAALGGPEFSTFGVCPSAAN